MPPRNKRVLSNEDPEWDDEDNYPGGRDGSATERLQLLIQELLGRWHWIALGLILGILGSLYYLAKAPKIYQATASLLVKQGASSVISGDREEDMDFRSEAAVNTVAERVKRVELLTRVASTAAVQELDGLIPPPTSLLPDWSQTWLGTPPAENSGTNLREPKNLANLIGGWMSVSVRRNTRLLDIAVSHRSPLVTQVLADAIATEYVKELADARSSGDTSSSDILGKTAAEMKGELQTSQNALANYQQALQTLKELVEKETLFSELDRRYLPAHPKHIGAKATVDEYQGRFLSEFDSVRKALADKDYWEGNRAEWDHADLDTGARLQIAKRLLTARANVLEGEIANMTEFYNSMITKLQVTGLNQKALNAEVELSSLSQLPKGPISPRKPVVLAGGIFLGAGMGFALAFLLTKLDNKIHTVTQAELLTNLHVLATIRDVQPRILEKIIAEEGELPEALPPAAQKWDPRIVFRAGLVESIYAETFRVLRASVTLLGDETKRKVTLFSSALPGEGKTLISANFAIASALQGKKTLLLDLDLRKPTIHKVFGRQREELTCGVAELLAGKVTWQEALSVETGQENLSCIFCGVKAPNPGELLNFKAFSALLAELEGEFEVIVVDSAPLLAVPDTRLLIPTVDNFCLVVRAESTPKGALRKVIDLLEDDGVEPAGMVINGYEEKTGFLAKKYRSGYGHGGYGQYGKGYGYGSYGSYGSDDK